MTEDERKRMTMMSRVFLASAISLLGLALLLNAGVLSLGPSDEPLSWLLTVAGIVEIGLALWFRSRAQRA